MAEEVQLSKSEHTKETSRQLRGTIAEELRSDIDHFCHESYELLKYHGTYQQDNRDARPGKTPGADGKSYIMMVRTRLPGGKLTAQQVLAELDLCDKYGNGTLRITSRQGFQLHSIVKSDLKATIAAINHAKLSTIAACGDVCRNVMCCPAPIKDAVHNEMRELTDRIAAHFRPRTTAYYEIWLEDENGEKTDVTDFQPVEEPIYGTRYLPRKFKIAVAPSDDNCVDLYANDIGLMAIVENGRIFGYNVVVGGSMGMKPANKRTFPAVAKRMTFVTLDQVIPVCEAIVKVQRDFGNREDRQQARMKYLIANWGLPKFKAKVEEYYGQPLPEPHPVDVTDVDDHIGWHEQGDGKLFLGINIENGRIKDEGSLRIKTGLRAILNKYGMNASLTPLQGILLHDIDPAWRNDIEQILRDHGIKLDHELSLVRRYAMSCPALPTCGLSVTESERIFPQVIDAIEAELARYGLAGDRISIHMTGCPNGCARPYTPDIGLVGKAKLKYTVYLGGNVEGTRMAFLYKDMVPLEEIALVLSPLFAYYKHERNPGESFGDFCNRKGQEDLLARSEQIAA